MFFSKIKQLNIDDTSYKASILSMFGILSLGFLYIYFLNNSIFNVVLREKYKREIKQVGGEVSSLENKYIEARNNINLELAHSLGYNNDFTNVHFSSEDKSLSGGLSLLGNEVR